MAWNNFDDLKGKCCFITGGTGVLGGAIVECLARSGVKVALASRTAGKAEQKAAALAEETGASLMGVGANVLDKETLVEAKKKINDCWGPVDIMINAAGGNAPEATTGVEMIEDADIDNLGKTLFGLKLEAFRTVFDLNFMGTLLPTMIFAPDMIKRKKGVILNVSSMNSFRPLTRIPAYSAAKAAVNNFTAWLAVHFAPRNIRVNAIAPGFFLTEQNRFLLYDKVTSSLTPRGSKVIAGTPMKRFGEAEELQGAVLYLCSEMSRFVTGVVLPVDGGFSAYSGV